MGDDDGDTLDTDALDRCVVVRGGLEDVPTVVVVV